MTNTARPAQIAYLKDLLAKQAVFNRDRSVATWTELGALQGQGGLTAELVSKHIDDVKASLRVQQRTVEGKALLASATSVTAEQGIEIAKRRNERDEVPAIPEGHYAVATDAGHLAFYRVRVNGRSGFVTVELQTSEEFQKLPWAQTKTILRKIDAVGALEAAKTYGRELKICGKCYRPLTNPESRALGIGPDCKKKYAA
jgi:hypothetical protein